MGFIQHLIDIKTEREFLKEIENKNKSVNEYAEALGLTVLGEYKLAKITQNSPKLTGEEKSTIETNSMFD